mmetsp:Transcript_68017/g.208466  ORF Transcript_68017/g.208466 Transcript_68017/m.208466 type:complete len:265 (+) Transcript_68017:172-966(+)
MHRLVLVVAEKPPIGDGHLRRGIATGGMRSGGHVYNFGARWPNLGQADGGDEFAVRHRHQRRGLLSGRTLWPLQRQSGQAVGRRHFRLRRLLASVVRRGLRADRDRLVRRHVRQGARLVRQRCERPPCFGHRRHGLPRSRDRDRPRLRRHEPSMRAVEWVASPLLRHPRDGPRWVGVNVALPGGVVHCVFRKLGVHLHGQKGRRRPCPSITTKQTQHQLRHVSAHAQRRGAARQTLRIHQGSAQVDVFAQAFAATLCNGLLACL